MLHRLYGPSFWVNSYHHQVVDRLGTGLRPTAFWNDKYVEAFEHTDLPIMAVQWHPEKLFDRDLHPELAAAERALVAKHMQMPNRPQTVSWRLLGYHATYIEMYADVLIAKAKGHDFETRERITRFQDAFGKFEQAIECYYDQANTFRAVSHFNRGTKSIILE